MKIKLKYRFALLLLNILSITWRVNLKNTQFPKKGIIVFWHGYMLPGWFAFKNRHAFAVISLSKDGELLAQFLKSWGYNFIRGSSSHGSKELLNELIEKANKHMILMTPDGPRGPIYQMKAGAVIAAQRAQVPVYLCGIIVKGKYTFVKSWDKFILPLPFSKIKITYKGPFYIDENLSKEQIDNKIKELENLLNRLYE